jgi:hypothetical protein
VTISNLRCDVCGRFLTGPADGIRFVYHPGAAGLRDDSGLACAACWAGLTRGIDVAAATRCAACGGPAPRRRSLHVRRFSDPGTWRLCAADAVRFLNALATVEPKLDPATFSFPEGSAGQ